MGSLGFSALAGLALLGALGVLFSGRRPTRAVLGLGAVAWAVSGVYALLGASFLALAQLLIYTGMVAVLWVVVQIPTRAPGAESAGRQPGMRLAAAILMLWVAAKGAALVVGGRQLWPEVPPLQGELREFGRLLYSDYLLALYVAGGLLLAGVVSAVVLGKRSFD